MDDAQRAFDALQKEGFSRDEISFIANKNASHSWGGDNARTDTGDTASNVAADAGIGAALGGVGGLLLSFAGLAIPGIGPILAAGPIVAALGGAGIGAAAGGMIGALTDSGIPEEEAHHYAEGVRRGDILITVRTDETRADRAASVMDDNGAVDIDHRVSNWRERGWERHDTSSQPLSEDELRREREYYSSTESQGDRWRDQTRRNTGMTSGSTGAGVTDFSAGTAGVTTGTGPGRTVGTEAGMGTGPGVGGTGDVGQRRGMTPTASPGGSMSTGGSLSNQEAVNARRDDRRTSDAAEGVIGSNRSDYTDTSRDLHTRDTSDNLAGEHDFRSATERMEESAKYHGDKLEHAGERMERGAENLGHRTENAFERAGDKVKEEGRDVKRGASRIYHRITD